MKKNYENGDWLDPLPKKICRVMKLTTLIILISIMHVSATVYSQTTKLSLNMQETTIKEVLQKIELLSEFRFIYQNEQVDLNKRINVQFEGERVENILDELFEGEEIEYSITANNLILIKSMNNSLRRNVHRNLAVQQKTISGKVTDPYGEPLPGVTIVVKGTNNGTVTNPDGHYSLTNIPENATLVFSFVGMRTQEIAVSGKSTIDVTLEEETVGIEEVVAIGYGTMKKSDLTGSVSSVKSEDLESVPVYNMEEALKSKSAGVRVTQNSGTPGSRVEVRIRGGNSMIGSNEPLYVVDGFPVTGGIGFLNPSDIESVNILKDASATAIYGSRGANGVVIITSKRGKTGQKGRIEVNTFMGMQETIGRYDVLNAKEYATIANEWLKNSGQDPYFNLNDIKDSGVNWQDLIFRTAPIQNHTITFSGSSEKTKFSLSGNFYDQEGIIINSGTKRGSFRLNLEKEMNNWLTMSVNLNLSRRERYSVPVDNGNYGGGSILDAALSAAPTLTVYDSNGLPTRLNQGYIWSESTMQNPMIWDSPYKNRGFANSVVGNTSFDIQLAKGLSLKTLLGVEYENSLSESFNPIIYDNDRGRAYQGNSYSNSFLNENTLNYTKTFNDDNVLTALAGITYQTNMNRYFNIGVNGFANNTTEEYDLSAAETVETPGTGYSEWTLLSYLGRVNFSVKNKYMFTASIRADGSSRFGEKHKWGMFPSGAFAWRVSDESFMKDIDLISDLKLRASYGLTGNTALSPYQSLDRLSSTKNVYGNQTDVIGFVPSGIANTDLKWETTAQFDLGLDFNVLDNKLQFTFDYYKKNTKDLLASVPLPPSIGFGSILKNIGEIENKGFEGSVEAAILNSDFKWNVSANISFNRNKIVKLAGGNDIYGAQQNLFRSSLNIARVGEPFGVFYGLKEDGLDENGYIKYKDLSGPDGVPDGIINSLDRGILGNPYPNFIYGFSTNFGYKDFTLDIYFEGVQGNDIFWATAGTHLNSFQRGNNQLRDLIGNYWTEANPDPNAKYPKISPSTLIDVSDRFIKDGSYLRVKSIKLAYNLSANKMGLNWLNNAQIYVSGTNLFTFTKYPGVDPGVNTTGTDSQSVGSRLRVGFDQSAYPAAKIYAVGFNLKF